MSERKPVIFYSQNCEYSNELLNKFHKSPAGFAEKFQFVNIDKMSSLPDYLTEVPTIVVPGNPNPLVGESCFMWVDTQIRLVSQSQQQQQRAPQQQQQQPGEIMDYNPLEMSSGFQDKFSFLDPEASTMHCFEFIDDDGNKQTKCVPVTPVNPNSQPQQQQRGPQAPQGMNVPDFLKPQDVGKKQSQQPMNLSYNPDVNSLNSGGNDRMTMSQHNNIRLQQQARQMPSMPNFQDPQRVQMNDNSYVTDQDYERMMNARNSDSSIMAAPQRI